MEVFNLDIIPGKAMPVIHCSQFDKGRAYRANLFERGAVYILNGAETLSIIEKKSDGNMVTISVTNTSDSFIEFEITEQMSAIAGPQLCELRIEEGGNVIGSLNFALDCEASPDTGIESDSAIHNLEEQIGEAVADQYDAEAVVFDNTPTAGHGVGFAVTSEGVLNAIPDELNDLSDVTITSPSNGEILVFDGAEWVNQANPASTANFAADYDDTATYNTNDKVIYQGRYYIALEDNITGAWDSTKWALTTVSALTAEELPLSGNDSTPTATAIGDLSTLTTSDKSSLVGAVNEVDKRTKPTIVTPTFNSSQNNYSIPFNNTKIYKIGNIVYFTSTIQADTPYGSSPGQDVYSGLPKPYSNDNIFMGFCAWNVTTDNVRVIVTADGKLQCRGGSTGRAYDIAFSYVCQ